MNKNLDGGKKEERKRKKGEGRKEKEERGRKKGEGRKEKEESWDDGERRKL